MSKPTLLEERPINMVELKEELARIKKRDHELGFRANKTSEYLSSVVAIKKKKAQDLYEKLEKLNVPRMKDIHIHKIIDLLPSSVEELKTIISSYTLTVNSENMKKIVSIVAEYAEEQK